MNEFDDLRYCILYWLLSPFYVTRLAFILDWMERQHDLILVWPQKIHWYTWPRLERASDSDYDETH
jgi:hypothetical protein